MVRLETQVFSDTCCPWCWVGKKRYDRAVAKVVAQHPALVIETRYSPYIIDPKIKESGEEYAAYNRRRWGSDAWTHGLRASGAPDGATFSDWRWWPNTLKAHQLVVLAERQGLEAQAAAEALFQATYERGLNVSDPAVLEQIAAELGVADAAAGLADDRLATEVRAADEHAKQALSIGGVPHFVVGAGPSRTVLHGAQSAAAFEQALRREVARLGAAAR